MAVFPGVEMFRGDANDCNIYLVDGELLIDAGRGTTFSDLKPVVQAATGQTKIKHIMLTHAHFDHSAGSKKFRDWTKAPIYIHPSDRVALETGKGTCAEMYGDVARIITAEKFLRAGMEFETRNFSFEVIHTPGHTPGSVCFYEKTKKLLFSGDTLFEHGVGRTDLPGGSIEDLMTSLKLLAGFQINYLFPGHGEVKTSGINFLIKQMIEQTERSAFI